LYNLQGKRKKAGTKDLQTVPRGIPQKKPSPLATIKTCAPQSERQIDGPCLR